MISLRQHAFSLAAVFLALAVGVVLGSGFLSDTLLSSLRDEKRDLYTQINGLNDQKNALTEKLSAANNFDTQLVGRMVHDALGGKTVVRLPHPGRQRRRRRGGGKDHRPGRRRRDRHGVADARSSSKPTRRRSYAPWSIRPILPAGAQLSTKLVDQGSQAGDLLGIALLINPNPPPRQSKMLSATPCWPRCATPASSPISPPTTSARPTPRSSSPAAGLPQDAGNQGVTVGPVLLRRWRRTAPARCSPGATARRRAAPRWR